MKEIKLLNKIAPVGLEVFDPTSYQLSAEAADPAGILVRSADMHSYELNPSLRAIARAGAGVNNIPLPRCTQAGIVVFNTPGGNANSVKELTLLALLLASRDVLGGIGWVKSLAGQQDIAKQVEAGKSAFAGQELLHRSLGVVGLGAVGGAVANAGLSLGMDVVGYDPGLSIDAAWQLSRNIGHASGPEEVCRQADYISLHVPSTAQTRGMINARSLSLMKDGVRLINMARADLVVEEDVKQALDAGKLACYVTDFPTDGLVGYKNVIAIPHLGASTEEAEDNCAVMAARQLKEYLENGNIRNSVNFPDVSMPHVGEARICILHRNVPNMLAQFSTKLGEIGINIENMLNRSRDEVAYTMIELRDQPLASVPDALRAIEGVIRVAVY